jgi:hypothetical protein
MSALSLHDDADGPPCVPASQPRNAPPSRRDSALAFAADLSHNPQLAVAVLRDLLKLAAIEDAVGALNAARSAVTTGDDEAYRVELKMALRCLRDALENDR